MNLYECELKCYVDHHGDNYQYILKLTEEKIKKELKLKVKTKSDAFRLKVI